MSTTNAADTVTPIVPNVVVVDPHFEAYKPLAASARLGKLNLHFRSSGADAVKLARQVRVDAWLIAADLDDMAGQDLVELIGKLRQSGDRPAAKIALVGDSEPTAADAVLGHPLTFQDLEALLGLPCEERAKVIGPADPRRLFVTLPVGVGAAALAIAVLMMG
jgi:CheY-like chemotaxis protein